VTLNRAQRLAIFVAIAFGGSWALAGVFHLAGTPLSPAASRALAILYVFPPAMAALVVQGALTRQPLVEPFGLRPRINRWVLVAWLLPLAILLLAFGIYAAWPGLDLITDQEAFADQLRRTVPAADRDLLEERLAEAPPPPPWRLLLHGMIGGVPFILLGLAEEIAWRGYLMEELRGGFWRRSFTIGLVWGAWLLPLAVGLGLYYPAHPEWGLLLLFGYTLTLSPALVLLRARSGTLWAPALTRSTLIALGRPALDITVGGDDRIAPFPGITGIVAAVVVVGVLIAVARRPTGGAAVRTRPSPAAAG
jgi:membrane protease YdiL (CAAX protease family)